MSPAPIAPIPVSSRRRSRWSSGERDDVEARAGERDGGRFDGVRLRVGRVGAERAIRELDVERVEDGLPRPLDRARCYQQIDRRKCGGRCWLGRDNQTARGEHPCPYYTNVLSRRLSFEPQTSVTNGRMSGRRFVFL
jgi:hypothetical protein